MSNALIYCLIVFLLVLSSWLEYRKFKRHAKQACWQWGKQRQQGKYLFMLRHTLRDFALFLFCANAITFFHALNSPLEWRFFSVDFWHIVMTLSITVFFLVRALLLWLMRERMCRDRLEANA